MAFQLFPSFVFNESNVGPRPVRQASIDRIAVVGVFNRGPLTPQLVDAESFRNLFGFTYDVGSVHVQAMIDQGANSFLIKRVLPAAVKASLTTSMSGTVTGAGSLDIVITSGASTATANVVLAGSEAASAVAGSVITAVNNLVANTFVTASAGSSGQVIFTARTAGADGNSITIRYTLNTSTGLTFTPSGIASTAQNLTGGVNAATPAVIQIKDVSNVVMFTLNAAWPGISGNSITGTLSAGSTTGKYDLELEYADENIVEVFRDIDFTDLYDEDKLVAFRSSQLVRGVVGNASVTPVLGNLTFTGGTDGPSTFTTDDFTLAIDELKEYQCTILTCPGLKPSGVDQKAIQLALVAQAEAISNTAGSEEIGLRMAIISAPRGTVVADFATLKTNNWIPDSKHAKMVVGWGTYAKLSKFKRFGIDGAALTAAHMLVTPVQVSLAARTSSPAIVGITEIDTPVGNSAKNEIQKARMDAIIGLNGGGFHMLLGRTTSSDPAWYWSCYRRVYNKVRQDLFDAFQFTKSEPSDPALDSVVQLTGNNYLEDLVDTRILNGYDPVVSNESNNSPAVRGAGKRFIDLGMELIPPNDNSQFNLNRVQRATVRFTIGGQ
jgi:phage tail sheath protein FI